MCVFVEVKHREFMFATRAIWSCVYLLFLIKLDLYSLS